MNKRILIVGVLDVEGSTNISMADGFKDLGCDVEVYNYRTVQKEIGVACMWVDFMAELSRSGTYDLIVFCKTNSMHPTVIHEARVYGPTWYWFMDNMEVAKAINATTLAQNATVASATASDVAERFGMINKHSHHMIEGFDPDVYYYEEHQKIHDVIFIGNATITRIIKINNLRSEGINVTLFGHGWPFGMKANPPVFGEDERTEINSSKVVLNLCHDDIIFSDRVVKSLGCGAVVVSDPCSDLLQSELNGLVYQFTSVENFKEIVDNLSLLQPSENIASHMALTYSWKAVCREMLKRSEIDK